MNTRIRGYISILFLFCSVCVRVFRIHFHLVVAVVAVVFISLFAFYMRHSAGIPFHDQVSACMLRNLM